MLLAGDIGGTKTDLALFSQESGPREPIRQAEFPSRDFASLEDIVREFLSSVDEPVERACFDVAGPVLKGHAKVTNLTWEVDSETLCKEFRLREVRLLNDLQAVSRAIPILEPEDLHTINKGSPVEHAAMAVVAPGTGLGEGFLTWDGTRYVAHPSEGGHADFAPTTPLETDLLHFLQAKYNHVSFERVCSGVGIPNIYDFLRDRDHAPENPDIAAELAEAQDRTRIIMKAGMDPDHPSPLCRATLETFASILAAEASNMALKVLATGGVYLAGGLPPRILPLLDQSSFMETFTRKGRMGKMLAAIPVHVVLQRKAALLGAASYGLEMG